MDATITPSDAARETLKRLATRKLAPTPDNFTEVYQEVAGGAAIGPESSPARMLEQLAADLAQSPGANTASSQLGRLVAARNWGKAQELLFGMARGSGDWAGLIRDLLRGFEARHAGWTAARKKESIAHASEAARGDSSKLYERLRRLIHYWAEAPRDVVLESLPKEAAESHNAGPPAEPEAASALLSPVSDATGDNHDLLHELLASTIVVALTQRLGEPTELSQSGEKIAARVRLARGAAEINACAADIRDLWLRMEARGKDQDEVLAGMLRLMSLLLENVTELVQEDRWLAGQLVVMREALVQPIDLKKLREAEWRFKDALLQQGTLKQSLGDVKAALKTMLATFIERLGTASETTGQFHTKIEGYAKRIQETDDISQLDRVLRDLMQDTRGMQTDMLRSRDELLETRKKVQDYEERIRSLERELSQVSEKVREDQLTQALNRRGLEETFTVEAARCRRKGRPLCVALLDIDNFKELNDCFGHKTGDDALVHLVGVMRETVRPSDSVARFGGEEFVILLPETELEEAVQVTKRVQRALTRRFFLADNQKLLITFSAGVAICGDDERRESVLGRADAALYAAKRAGKNRVVSARV
ncbi:MAG: diguanylate cyclase [Betaproteobacteria bacterium]|nr:diguanylate cyclase [Betaproteobacteria bacterium]